MFVGFLLNLFSSLILRTYLEPESDISKLRLDDNDSLYISLSFLRQ